MDDFDSLQSCLNKGLSELSKLWSEIGLDEEKTNERKKTVNFQFQNIMDRMIKEENNFKSRLLDSLESNSRICVRLSKEMGVNFEEPDSNLPLLSLQVSVKEQAQKLEKMKELRMREVLSLKSKDEDLCHRLCMDPFYISSDVVPTTAQLEQLKDHIRRMEDEKFLREERFIELKDSILMLYEELEDEPVTDMEREIACEDADRFILSSSNLGQVEEVQRVLHSKIKANQKQHMLYVEKIESLYERLKLDMTDKFKFLSLHQGHGKSVLCDMKIEIDRLEEIKKANIEQFIINLRDELHGIWDDCYYSPEQRNSFEALHSVNFTEELLEKHEEEVAVMKDYFEQHKELFSRVAQRQEVWNKFMELERKAKDPSRLMNSRGNTLLMEEKERNKVNKALPRIEQDLQELIFQWEQIQGKEFKVGGVSFSAFIEQQKEEHIRALETEKIAREKKKKEDLLHETRFGAKPITPAKLKHNSTKTPRKLASTPLGKGSASTSRLVRKVSSAVATIRSPRAGRIGKGLSPRYGVTNNKTKKVTAAMEKKLKRGVLTQSNYTLVNQSVVKGHRNTSVASTVPDYANFKEGDMLNSTEALSIVTPEVTRSQASYLTPTASSTNRMFKTPNSVSRSRLGTPKAVSRSTPQLSRLRSGKNLPMLF